MRPKNLPPLIVMSFTYVRFQIILNTLNLNFHFKEELIFRLDDKCNILGLFFDNFHVIVLILLYFS